MLRACGHPVGEMAVLQEGEHRSARIELRAVGGSLGRETLSGIPRSPDRRRPAPPGTTRARFPAGTRSPMPRRCRSVSAVLALPQTCPTASPVAGRRGGTGTGVRTGGSARRAGASPSAPGPSTASPSAPPAPRPAGTRTHPPGPRRRAPPYGPTGRNPCGSPCAAPAGARPPARTPPRSCPRSASGRRRRPGATARPRRGPARPPATTRPPRPGGVPQAVQAVGAVTDDPVAERPGTDACARGQGDGAQPVAAVAEPVFPGQFAGP